MMFKAEFTVRDLWLSSEDVLTFDFGGKHALKVILNRPSEEEQTLGVKPEHAICTVFCSRDVKQKHIDQFHNILNDKVLPNSRPEEGSIQTSLSDGETLHIPPPTHFPESFQDFLESVRRELRAKSEKAIAVLRWRTNAHGPHSPLRGRGYSWSFDGERWYPLPGGWYAAGIPTIGPLPVSSAIENDVSEIVAADQSEPLHHNLFREAWEQRDKNPRSAIVIGMAAAEIGTKHCISELVPEAEWLVTNIPSPPLIKMLNDFMPLLPAKCDVAGSVKPPPPVILGVLKKGVRIRNLLAHASHPDVTTKTAEEVLTAVKDLLWLVDFYCGHEWAFEFLRAETQAALLPDQA